MSTQPEALRLANALESDPMVLCYCTQAAAELRRLHEVNKELVRTLADARCWHDSDKWRHGDADERLAWRTQRDRIDAAIAKATGEQE